MSGLYMDRLLDHHIEEDLKLFIESIPAVQVAHPKSIFSTSDSSNTSSSTSQLNEDDILDAQIPDPIQLPEQICAEAASIPSTSSYLSHMSNEQLDSLLSQLRILSTESLSVFESGDKDTRFLALTLYGIMMVITVLRSFPGDQEYRREELSSSQVGAVITPVTRSKPKNI
ncbi:hypothetical protein C8J55DRAFT_489527 [Lentinula edodes]|uniref:Uncharacterized protein n=1 Tax=Lentinula lateritia TaxID=40482 RepID=A0A9W9DPC8_9AGAR|nr:hypothetical protein C8J55DRAFT_489527 [Lentinula edodes]